MLYSHENIHSSIPHSTPFVLLKDDNWNDWFKFATMYRLYYYDNKDTPELFIGRLKIGQKKLQDGRAEIPEIFKSLGASFFSIGETVDYYTNLYSLTNEVAKQILIDLNDIAFNTDLLIENLTENVMSVSLLRGYSQAEILGQVHRIAHGGAKLTDYEFRYYFPKIIKLDAKEYQVDSAVSFDVNVEPESRPPSNIHVIIGRNGVGKTFLIQNIIKAVRNSDQQDYTGYFSCQHDLDNKEGVFEPKKEFANLICIAFSAFDSFPPSEDIENGPFKFPYIYIGLDEQQDGSSRFEHLAEQFYKSLCVCISSQAKNDLWKDALTILNYDTFFNESGITDIKYPNSKDKLQEFEHHIQYIFNRLSSGHKIILLTMVQLIEKVEEKSLVIIDEPETHLHPPLLSAFIRALSELLIKRNAVAIITTHSPIILQEIPANCAWKMRRSGIEVSLHHIEQESFGTNINSLTHEVFGLDIEKTGFYELLRRDISYDEYDFDKVKKRYKDNLGDDALVMLRLLSLHKGGIDENTKQT